MATDEPGIREGAGVLVGVRVVELSDETASHAGLLLAGLGAEVIKVEPPAGCPTRRIGPMLDGEWCGDRSVFFLQHNRGKRSVVLDLDDGADQDRFRALVGTADVLLESAPLGYLDGRRCSPQDLRRADPSLVTARMTAFGDDGPWSSFRGSDLVHLALGGPMMNCGYDPQPDGTYDLPPIAPQAWHSYIIAGEQLIIGILAALVVRQPGHPAALAGVTELSGFPERSSSANRRRRRSCPRSRDGSPAKTRWTQS